MAVELYVLKCLLNQKDSASAPSTQKKEKEGEEGPRRWHRGWGWSWTWSWWCQDQKHPGLFREQVSRSIIEVICLVGKKTVKDVVGTWISNHRVVSTSSSIKM